MRVRDDDRSFEKSAFLHPGGAGHFAIAVQTENAGVNWIVERIVSARNDRGHPGAHWTVANIEFAFAADQSRVADFHAAHVSDGIKFSRRSFEWNAELARPDNLVFRCRSWRRRFLRLARRRIDHDYEHERQHEKNAVPRFHFRFNQLSTTNHQLFRLD